MTATLTDAQIDELEGRKWDDAHPDEREPTPAPVPEAEERGVRARTGARELADIDPSPAPPRRFGRWEEGAHSLLYGTGGVGKGLVIAWDIGRLVADGERVLIVDYEDHGDEWSRRVGAMAGADARGDVLHVAPLDPGRWRGPTGPLWAIAPALRELADDFGATWVVVDSIGPACYGADYARDGNVPTQYAGAVRLVGRSTISIGQVNRAGDMRYPFGSVVWHYQARASWSIETAPGGERGTSLLLTDRKSNNHARAERVQADVTWFEDLPREVAERPYLLALADRIAIVLEDGPRKAADVVSELNAEAESESEMVAAAVVRQALRRGLVATGRTPKRFTVAGKGKDAVWGNEP